MAKASDITVSEDWLGNHSTKDKIKASGLWQVNELYNEVLNESEFDQLKNKISKLK